MILKLDKKVTNKDIEVGDIIRNKTTKEAFMILERESDNKYCLLILRTNKVTNSSYDLDTLLSEYGINIDTMNNNDLELIKGDRLILYLV